MRFLAPGELTKLADTIDSRYRAFVILAGYSGLRLGELLALRWSCVDVRRRQIQVSETLSSVKGHISFGPPKTRAAIRTVGVPGFVIDELLSVGTTSAPQRPVLPIAFSSPPKASPSGRRCFVDASGNPLSTLPASHRSASTTYATPRSLSGSPPEHTPDRSPCAPVTTSVSVVLDRYRHLLSNHEEAFLQALEVLGTAGQTTARSDPKAQDRHRRDPSRGHPTWPSTQHEQAPPLIQAR
jgi:hypothetical protein